MSKFNWTLPVVGGSRNVWGTILNTMFSSMDSEVQRVTAISVSAPSDPSIGDMWIDTSSGQILKSWSGSAWVTLTGLGATQLSELSDVGVSTPTDGNVLSADGSDFDSKSLDDAGIVAKTGAQTVAGIKTFSSFPVTPSSAPTTDYQVSNKKYVDDSDVAAGSNTGDIIRWNAGTSVWEVKAEPLAFTQINLTPQAAAVANSEGGLYYDSGEKAVKVCVDI